VKWLERDLVTGPYLGLATNEKDFRKALRTLKVPREKWPAAWLNDDATANCSTFTNPSGGIACVVCVRLGEQSGIEAAATLVHEAVHVWQTWCDYKGERDPSIEFEAYAIESIAKRLMQAYAALTTANPMQSL
jgi:hypothetical protein